MNSKNLIIVVCFLVTSFLIIPAAFAGYQTVTIVKAKGVIEVIPLGQEEGSAAIAGTKLKEGDTVKTYDGSEAEISFGGVGIVYVKPSSSLTINKAREAGKVTETITMLKNGEIKAKVRKLAKASTFETRTPVSVAAVRGTTYVVNVTQGGVTQVHVLEGMVELTSLLTGLGVTIDQAHFSTVDSSGEVSSPLPDTQLVEVNLDELLTEEGGEGDEQSGQVDSRSVQAEEIADKENPASPA